MDNLGLAANKREQARTMSGKAPGFAKEVVFTKPKPSWQKQSFCSFVRVGSRLTFSSFVRFCSFLFVADILFLKGAGKRRPYTRVTVFGSLFLSKSLIPNSESRSPRLPPTGPFYGPVTGRKRHEFHNHHPADFCARSLCFYHTGEESSMGLLEKNAWFGFIG